MRKIDYDDEENYFSSSKENWRFLKYIYDQEESNNNDSLLVYCLTYNLQANIPTNEELYALFPDVKSYDLIAVNTQECQKSITSSFFNSDKDEWEHLLTDFFRQFDYENIAKNNLGAMNLMIFSTLSKHNNISVIKTGTIKTGFLNIVSNKGAIGISVQYLNKNLLFINCHLTHGTENAARRNDDFNRIRKSLTLNFSSSINNSKVDANSYKEVLSSDDIYDCIIWCGDFNYKLNLSLEQAKQLIDEKNYDKLLEYDQLLNDNLADINVGKDYLEGKITFMPTYKFLKDENDYNFERIPGWTDRILYKAREINDISLLEYNVNASIKISDHRPVYAVFKIKISDKEKDDLLLLNKAPKDNDCILI